MHRSETGLSCAIQFGMRAPLKNNASLAQFTRPRLHPTEDDDANYISGSSEKSTHEKFCSTSTYVVGEDTQLIGIRLGQHFVINPMKTLLIASLCSVTL